MSKVPSGDVRRRREVVTIPSLRALGNLLLFLTIVVHNRLVLGHLDLVGLAVFGAVQLGYTMASTWILARFYREDARLDLGVVFLTLDIAIFVGAIYVSGGERSWLLPLLCVRVADQVATSRRRALTFATLTLSLHGGLVLCLAFVGHRALALDVELAKVGFVYLMNLYLALAAGPAEKQRKEAQQATAMARRLIAELDSRTKQLEVERARAESANRAKGTFLANVSHEIRTPMNAVLGMTELLLEEPLPEKQREMAQTVLTASKSLLAIVNDVLDMSKVEAGQLRLRLGDMDLAELVESVRSPMQVLAHDKGLELRTELHAAPERAIRGDELRLRQVLFNLTGNAIKFTQSGSVTVRVRASALQEDSVRLVFSVEDTGIGMTEEAAQRVFRAFEQADESTTRAFGGTGLGLTISKQLVALMGGNLTVRSVLGRGSVFEFEIPCALGAARAESEARVGDRLTARLRARNPRVLVTEDNEVNRMLLQRWLERFGCRVSTAEDGAQAVRELTREHDFDLVFMDWQMPVLDGLDATRQIRTWESASARPRTPIIGFTASAFAEEIERCRHAGMDDVLSKPLVRAQLEQKLHQYLAGSFGAKPRPAVEDDREPHVDSAMIAELRAIDCEQGSFLQELLGSFLQKAPGRLRDLADAAARGDRVRIKTGAHGLRGSAGGVGAKRLTALATALEFQAAAEPMGDVYAALHALEEEFECVRAVLESVLEEPERSSLDSPPASDGPSA